MLVLSQLIDEFLETLILESGSGELTFIKSSIHQIPPGSLIQIKKDYF